MNYQSIKRVIIILNFDVPLPRPHCIDVSKYKHANTERIQEAISAFDWSKAFLHGNANENSKILTGILLNVFRNFLLNKTQKPD